MFIFTYTYMYSYIYIYIYIYTYIYCIFMCTHICMYTHIYINIFIHLCIFIQTCTYIYCSSSQGGREEVYYNHCSSLVAGDTGWEHRLRVPAGRSNSQSGQEDAQSHRDHHRVRRPCCRPWNWGRHLHHPYRKQRDRANRPSRSAGVCCLGYPCHAVLGLVHVGTLVTVVAVRHGLLPLP